MGKKKGKYYPMTKKMRKKYKSYIFRLSDGSKLITAGVFKKSSAIRKALSWEKSKFNKNKVKVYGIRKKRR